MDSLIYGILAYGAIMIILSLIVLVVAIAAYICRSLTLYRLFSAAYYPNAWMAWLPFCKQYAMVDMEESSSPDGCNVSYFNKINLPIPLCKFWFLICVLGCLPYIGWIIVLGAHVFFTLGNTTTMIANMRGTDPNSEVFPTLVAFLPFADAVYFNKVYKEING